MRSEILEILEDIRPDVDFEAEKQLVTDGILESMDIVALVAALEDEFDVEIRAKELIPENFDSLEALEGMIERLEEE